MWGGEEGTSGDGEGVKMGTIDGIGTLSRLNPFSVRIGNSVKKSLGDLSSLVSWC